MNFWITFHSIYKNHIYIQIHDHSLHSNGLTLFRDVIKWYRFWNDSQFKQYCEIEEIDNFFLIKSMCFRPPTFFADILIRKIISIFFPDMMCLCVHVYFNVLTDSVESVSKNEQYRYQLYFNDDIPNDNIKLCWRWHTKNIKSKRKTNQNWIL